MTISTNNRNDAAGNDSTATYPYGFKIFAATDLQVTLRNAAGVETLLSYPTAYSVTNVGLAAGGNVVLSSLGVVYQNVDGTLKTGYSIAIRRVRPLSQTTDLRNQGGFFAATHEDEFDNLTMIDQQQQDAIDRSLHVPPSAYGVDTELPIPLGGSAFGWNAAGNKIINIALSTGTTLANLAASTGAALIGFLQAGAGAFLRTLQDKNRESVSVMDFLDPASATYAKIKAFNSSGQDTAAVTAAFRAALAAADNVHVPAGYYVPAADTIVVPEYKRLHGDGFKTAIWGNVTAGTPLFRLGALTKVGNSWNCGIENLQILPAADTVGIELYQCINGSVRDICIAGAGGAYTGITGFQVDGGEASAFFNHFDNCNATQVKYGYRMFTTGTGVAGYPTSQLFTNCSANGVNTSGSIGYLFERAGAGSAVAGVFCGGQSVIVGGNVEGLEVGVSLAGQLAANYDSGAYKTTPSAVYIYGLRFESCTYDVEGWTYSTKNVFAGGANPTTYRGFNPNSYSVVPLSVPFVDVSSTIAEYSANKGTLSHASGHTVLWAFGADGTTQGTIGLALSSSDGTPQDEYVTLTKDDCSFKGLVIPGAHNTYDLGKTSARWKDVWCQTAAFNGSDARLKTPLAALTKNEIEAAKQMAREIGSYQWLESIKAKGDSARHHVGLTVQRAMEIMRENSLDPFAYGFIGYDKWDDEYIEHARIEATDGKPAVPAWRQLRTKAGDAYSFRESQLNLFIAAGFEARLRDLEAKAAA